MAKNEGSREDPKENRMLETSCELMLRLRRDIVAIRLLSEQSVTSRSSRLRVKHLGRYV